MGRRRGGDKIHNKKKELKRNDFKRKVNNRDTVPDIIIACEDSISSPAYFRMCISSLIKDKIITQDSFVIVKPSHTNPKGVLEDLKSYEDENDKKYKDFDHKWIVIDRDIERVNGGGHTAEDFNNAIKNAKNKRSNLNIKVAYVNDSFELWYLLHFDYRNTAILRDEIIKVVIAKLKQLDSHKFSRLNRDNIKQANYTKMIYEDLLPMQANAIVNAKRLIESYGDEHNPEKDNPSTTVYILVTLLNGLFQDK